MCIVGLIFLYVLSVYLNWKYVHISADPIKGKHPYSFIKSDLNTEMILIFIPVINTIGTIRWIIDWPYKNPLFKINAKKFFKIKD